MAFDAAAHQAFIDKVIADHGKTFFERVKKWGTSSDLPVFIVGMPGSGCFQVEQILGGHPTVVQAGEPGSIQRFVTQFRPDAKSISTSQLLPNVRVTRQLAADYLDHLARLGQGAARVLVGDGETYLALGLIGTLVPQARVIYCRRDALDTCVSCYLQNAPAMPFACTLEDIGAYYRAYEKLMAHWLRVLPCRFHEVRYEKLVGNGETSARDLISFVGLSWHGRCASAASRPDALRGVGRWRQYQAHLQPLFQSLGLTALPT